MKTEFLVQIKNGLAENKKFFVSGYANPNLRNKPQSNIKPVEVTFMRNDPASPFRTGLYYNDRCCYLLIAKTDKGQIISASNHIYVFDDYESAVQHYNEEVQKVADAYSKLLTKTLGNKI